MNKSSIWTLSVIGVILILFVSFIGCERIDAGAVGLKVNNVGGEKGVSKTEYVTGFVWYLKPLTRVFEYPTAMQHKDYDPYIVPSKGGTIFTVHPSFNYNIEPGHVADMFQKYRQSVNSLENNYLKNAVLVTLREVTNTFTVDSILNNLVSYDMAVVNKLNEKLHPYFVVTTFTSGLTPDEGLQKTISEKAQAIQNAIKIENQQKAIKAQAENDIIGAKRDSVVKVTGAAAEARTVQLMQEQLEKSPQYVELIKWQRWNGVLPVYMFGNSQQMLLGLNPKQ